MFLSQLPEEIVCADENRMLEEMKYMNTPSQDNALKQLMSFEMPLSKPQRTIMYLGENDHYGTTVQKIAVNDPNMQCKKTSARNNGLFGKYTILAPQLGSILLSASISVVFGTI